MKLAVIFLLMVAGTIASAADMAALNAEVHKFTGMPEGTELTPALKITIEDLNARLRTILNADPRSPEGAEAEVRIHELREKMRDMGAGLDRDKLFRARIQEFTRVEPKFDAEGNPLFQELTLNVHPQYAVGSAWDGFTFVAPNDTGVVWGGKLKSIAQYYILDLAGEAVGISQPWGASSYGWHMHPESSKPNEQIVMRTVPLPPGLKKGHTYLMYFEMASNDPVKMDVILNFVNAPNDPTKIAEALGFKSKFEETKAAAERGNARAQFVLGRMYTYHIAAPVDYSEALKWYMKAVEQGFGEAEMEVASLYFAGNGVPRDPNKAIEHIKHGVELGSPEAMNALGSMYVNGYGPITKDWAAAEKLLSKASELGNLQAESLLAYIYSHTQRETQHFEHTLHAATGGDPIGIGNLGIAYSKGEGTAVNDLEAFRWLVKGVFEGNASNPYYLGMMYENGRAVDRNVNKAYHFYQVGSQMGEPWCRYRIGRRLYEGDGVEKNYVEAIQYLTYAAQRNVAPAAMLLGTMYEDGSGVAKNQPEADKWYKVAAGLGDEDARQKLNRHEPTPTKSDF